MGEVYNRPVSNDAILAELRGKPRQAGPNLARLAGLNQQAYREHAREPEDRVEIDWSKHQAER